MQHIQRTFKTRRLTAQVAVKLLRDRANDGSQQFVNFVPSPQNGPVGKHHLTGVLDAQPQAMMATLPIE